MAFTPPTTPDECFALSPFGFGPFPQPGQSVTICPAHPTGSGYGGASYAPNTIITDPGGTPFGLGGSGGMSAPPLNVTGGYGGDPFGIGPYGGTEKTPPQLSSALSLNGFEIEVFFSEEMDLNNALLTDPSAYTLTPVVGAPATPTSVTVEKLGSVNLGAGDTVAGATSVIVRHTGTTLGGTYTVGVTGITDIAGNEILEFQASLLTKGDAPSFTVAATSGETLELTFSQDMLGDADEPTGTVAGIEAPASYQFTASPTYPIDLVPLVVTHPQGGDAAKVGMTVKGMTSLPYTANITPAKAINYDGSVLPDAATGFTGAELNPANGSSLIANGQLSMTRSPNVPYGWDFRDTSGLVVPAASTFRVDVGIDAATYEPVLSAFSSPQVGQFVIEDGPVGSGVQVLLTLQRAADDSDEIRIQSGTFDTTVKAAWSTGAHTISLVRNRKAGIYAILFDELPLTATAMVNFNQVAQGTGAGVSWTLYGEAYSVAGFKITKVLFSATTTVFSAAWNFLHDATASFTGSAALTRNVLDTQRGPLVKGWGDATPATKQDVLVLVNGLPVTLSDVNPYTGRVTMQTPIPLLPLGDPQSDVKVDYKWFQSPVMEMTGLNTEGLILNKFDRHRGHHDPSGHGEQVQDATNPKGAPDTARFPMAVVLGPPTRTTPLHIGHRYIGFEREYSAVLNSPTTMKLNESPYEVAVPKMEVDTLGSSEAYEGKVIPTSDGWAVQGTDAGQVDINQGTFTVVDDQGGPYDPADPQAVVYSQEADLTFPSSIFLVGRFLVDTSTGFAPDGVFTGVGFGIHDNARLYLAGALRINGVEHTGLLQNAKEPHNEGSWLIGPKASATITAKDTVSFTTSATPVDLIAGDRFQVLTGSQKAVYTTSSVVRQTDGTTTVRVSPDFPADFTKYGNKFPDCYFETPWSTKASSYRLEVDPDQEVATLTVSGTTTAKVAVLDGKTAAVPQPSESALLFDTSDKGQVFWGSLSRRATSRSTWSFFRYGIVPDQTAVRGNSKTVNTEMGELPERQPGDDWFNTQTFGSAKVDATADNVVLKATSENATLDFTFGYRRTEPFFVSDTNFDLRAKYRVESGTLGAGDSQIVLNDTLREVRLSNLLFIQQPGLLEYRKLIDLPVSSFAGLLEPTDQGWTKTTGHNLTDDVEAQVFKTTQAAGQTGGYSTSLTPTNLAFTDSRGRLFEARFAVSAYTAVASGALKDRTGIRIGADIEIISGAWGFVGLELRAGATPGVNLIDSTGAVQQSYDFDWTDGEPHTYRVQCDVASDVVSVWIDDTLVSPTLALAANFAGGGGSATVMTAGSFNSAGGTTDNTLTATVLWNSASISFMPPSSAKRTMGIYRGGDETLINSYEVPRSDSSTAPNSAETGPVVQEWDWRSFMDIRLLRTPDWGVTLYRPDLPLPPFYVPETPGVAGTGFITETTEPSAGWINVEYDNLPRVPSEFGFVQFGSFEKGSVTQQRWDWVRYRLFKALLEDHKTAHHMILNQFNVITSGELGEDKVLETVVVEILDNRRVSLLPTHLYADEIYKVIDGTTSYTREAWTFDSESQTITLQPDAAGNDRTFSGAAVTVVFTAGDPLTNTYLLNQPLLDGVTNLNEGTPPFPKHQDSDAVHEVVFGSALNDPTDTLNDDSDFTLNDPYRVETFKDDADSLYECMSFMEVKDTGVTGIIATPGEGMLPEGFSGFAAAEGEAVYSPTGGGASLGGVGDSAGLFDTGTKVGAPTGAHVLNFSGTQFWQNAKFPQQPDWQQKGGMPGGMLFASGGSYMGPVVNSAGVTTGVGPLGGTIGPGSAVLYPSYPSHDNPALRGTDRGKVYRRTDWYIRLNSVLTDGRIDQMVGTPASAGLPVILVPTSVGSLGVGSVGTSVGSSVGSAINEFWEVPLAEDVLSSEIDNVPPTRPWNWSVNPNGTAGAGGLGAVLFIQQGAGEYSRWGPWGGLSALTPDPDTGYFEFGAGLLDGTTVEVTEESTSTTIVFTARAVPVGPNEFAIAPQPHVNLAAAINNHPTASGYVIAEAGLTLGGALSVLVTAKAPVVADNLLSLSSDNPAAIRLTGLDPAGALTGGAKILQSSLLAGGSSSLEDNIHTSTLGMVCQGGAVLPAGRTTLLTLNATP